MAPHPLAGIANVIRDELKENPELTVDELVTKLHESDVDYGIQVDHNDVAQVLDEFLVQEKKVVHVGPGGGGDWV